MASFHSELLSTKAVKNKILQVTSNDRGFNTWANYDPEYKTLIFFIYVVNTLNKSASLKETFKKLEAINFFETCSRAVNEKNDVMGEVFQKAVELASKSLSTLLLPEQVPSFTQLCKTTSDLIILNYKVIPFEMSATDNLNNNYDSKIDGAIRQCKLVDECHMLLRKVSPDNMNQLAVLLNNLLLPLEK